MKNRDGETAAGGCAAEVVTTGRLPGFAVGAWDDTVLVDGGVSSGVVSASGAKPGESDVGRVVEAARTKLNNWYREISQFVEIRKILLVLSGGKMNCLILQRADVTLRRERSRSFRRERRAKSNRACQGKIGLVFASSSTRRVFALFKVLSMHCFFYCTVFVFMVNEAFFAVRKIDGGQDNIRTPIREPCSFSLFSPIKKKILQVFRNLN